MNILAAIGELLLGLITIQNNLHALFSKESFFPALPAGPRNVYLVAFAVLGAFISIGSIGRFLSVCQKSTRRHTFRFQSRKFFKFFANWYGQPGALSIICDDLDWIRSPADDRIYQALLQKSGEARLKLMLGDGINGGLVKELQQAGAEVVEAPRDIVAQYTFSCLSVMGNKAGRIIVREKRRDERGKIIFDEITNTYITELMNVLLRQKEGGPAQ